MSSVTLRVAAFAREPQRRIVVLRGCFQSESAAAASVE